MIRKHGILTVLLLLYALTASAQKRVSADVETKTLVGNSVVTATKTVYCSNNGRLVVAVHKPLEYIMETNVNRETRFYFPNTNEVLVENSGMEGASDELLSLFLFGRLEDLGVGLEGYRLLATENVEDGMVKKTFRTEKKELPPFCEIVYKDYLPIFSATLDADRNYITKVYYSQYREVGWLPFPHRSTMITYTSPKDSTITRTIYSNVVLDGDDPMFDFTVPSNAKPMDMSDKNRK